MGWRGAVRSVNAELKRMERAAEQRHRQQMREQETALSASVVEAHESVIAALTTIHHAQPKRVDWDALCHGAAPVEPTRTTFAEKQARRALDSYSPSWRDKLFNSEQNKRRNLEERLQNAIKQDESEHHLALEKWKEATVVWKRDKELAERMLSGVDEAWIDAVEAHSAFQDPENRNLGSGDSQVELMGEGNLDVDGKNISLTVHTFGAELVPTEAHKQLKSGKLSTRDMPKNRYWSIYLDYVVGCALRAGSEILAVLPADKIIVTVLEKRLNPATGYVESMPILSVLIPRRTLDALNLPNTQAGATLTQFKHAIDFRKTQGFRTIEPLEH